MKISNIKWYGTNSDKLPKEVLIPNDIETKLKVNTTVEDMHNEINNWLMNNFNNKCKKFYICNNNNIHTNNNFIDFEELLNSLDFTTDPIIDENGILRGWQIESFTPAGGDMYEYLYFDGDEDPFDLNDFDLSFYRLIEGDANIDDIIDANLQSAYSWGLSAADLCDDINEYYDNLDDKYLVVHELFRKHLKKERSFGSL